MTVHIKSDHVVSGPGGLDWPEAGAVVAVDDHKVAHDLLKLPGFHAVAPTEAPAAPKAPEPPEKETSKDAEKAANVPEAPARGK